MDDVLKSAWSGWHHSLKMVSSTKGTKIHEQNRICKEFVCHAKTQRNLLDMMTGLTEIFPNYFLAKKIQKNTKINCPLPAPHFLHLP